MPRRVSLPAADDIFRPTTPPAEPDHAGERASGQAGQRRADEAGPTARRTARGPSGRVRHDEKMTVYVTSEELLELEHARLALRRDHSLAVDRGRLVREAIALVLADLDAHGADSALVRRLSDG